MKLVATHPVGVEIHLTGRRGSVLRTYAQWWNACSDMLDKATPEPEGDSDQGDESEPQPQGSNAQVERAYPRYFEAEGLHQDVPIIQSKAAHPLGFALPTPREEVAA